MDQCECTVVIPVWDEYVRFLPAAVESARRDGSDVRVVVVDNASTSELPTLPSASVVRSSHRLSVGAARSLGLEHVETDAVLFLDADDELLPGALAFMRERLATDPSLSVSSTAVLDAATGERHRFPRRFVRPLTRRARLFALADCVWSLFPIQGCALLRTAQVRDCGGYPDAEWGDDWVLALSLAFRGRVELDERLGRLYRSTPASISARSRTTSDFLAEIRHVRERIRSDRGIPRWTRALLPMIAALQFVVVFIARPAYLAARSLLGEG
jgi:glycosyltransferase involved in cell wall biosynthesis